MSRVKKLVIAIILVVGILFPTTTLASPEATVSITDAILPTGATGSVALTISGISADRPVSCITVDVNYEPSVVEVLSVSSGDFSSLVDNIQNPDGYTRLVAWVTSETGLTGTIKVADITVKRLGGESELALDVITLKDDDGNSIPFTVVNGWVAAPAPSPPPPVPPAIVTSPATSVTTTSATLNGTLTDLGTVSSVRVSFEWGITTAYGNETTARTMTSTGAFSSSLSGLTSDTTYHFRVKAVGDGTSYGLDRSFTTGTVPTVPPAVTTDPATGVTTTLASLNGSLTDLGTATAVRVSFDWGETSAYGNETIPRTMTSTGAFSSSLSGLTSDTTYHFRAKAVGDGTSYGLDRTFTTGTVPTVPPAVTTDPATGVTTTLASLNGSLTDLGTATAVRVSFEWGTTDAYGNETTPRTMTSTGPFSSSLSGLSPDTTYHFRAKAVGDGTSYGLDRTFTTEVIPTVPPAVTTDPATGVTTTLASLNGSLTDLGTALSVAVSFEWGTTDAYGNETTPRTMTSTGPFSSSLSGLSPDTTYHFRAKAVGDGTSYGLDRTFTTGTVPTVPPAVTTDPATGVTTTLASLNGSLTDLGTALSVAVSFEWGTTTAYGNETTPRTMTSTGPFSSSLSGLSPDTTYHFRAKAVGDGPPAYGADRTFTTRARPPAGGGGIGHRRVPAGTTDVRGEISAAGVFEEPVTAFSDDELCTLTIPEGTVGLTEDLEPLDEITILREDDPPEPPEDADIVLAYDLGPDGATFDPAITLTFSYDPADIPEGKDVLVVAYYDEVAEAWVYLEGVVDTVTKTITVSISHFTTFAIIGTVKPAFTLSSLHVSPTVVAPGEKVNIIVSVANTGGREGSYTVVLKINGVKEAQKSVTVAAGESQEVSFTVAKEVGSYSVTIDGLSGTFTVVAPAAFSVSDLSIQPAEVEPKEAVTIIVSVANTGGTEGSYSVVLMINGAKEEEKSVTIAAGSSEEVSFSVTREEARTYSVVVDGLSGSFTIAAPAPPEKPPINWPLIGGIIAAVVVVGLLIFFLIRRKAA